MRRISIFQSLLALAVVILLVIALGLVPKDSNAQGAPAAPTMAAASYGPFVPPIVPPTAKPTNTTAPEILPVWINTEIGTPAGDPGNPFVNEDCVRVPTIEFPAHNFKIYTSNMAFSGTTLELTVAGIKYERRLGRVIPREIVNDGAQVIFSDVQPEKGFYLVVRDKNGQVISRFSYAPVLTNCRAASAYLLISSMDSETPRLSLNTPPVNLWPVGREFVIPAVEDTARLPRAFNAGTW